MTLILLPPNPIMKAEIISVDDKGAVAKAVSTLKKGGLAIYPTETSYGLGADATNGKAIKKIYKLKGRKEGKAIPVIVSSLEMIKKYCVIDAKAARITKKFAKKPLTIIVPNRNFPEELCSDSVGFRIPGNEFALKMARRFGKPITTTSANLSGKPPIYNISEILKTFSGKVDLIIDAGGLPERKPTTVYCTIKGKVLREGDIIEKEIANVINS